VRFTQTYSTGRCWPSRACILTGHYPQQIRMDPPRGRIPSWARVLPHYLKPQGYHCYHSGKWHLFGAPKAVADGGFDRSYLIHDQDRYFSPQALEEDDTPLPAVDRESGFYATTEIGRRGAAYLARHAEEHGDDPFCLYLAFTAPHFPLHALQEDIDLYRDRYRAGWDRIREARWNRMREQGIVTCELSPLDPETVPDWNLSEPELQDRIGDGEAGRALPWEQLSAGQQEFQATKMAVHAAMIHRMDTEIGRVLDQLRTMGAEDNTLVLFVSDNGASAEQIIRGDMHDQRAAPGSADSYLCLGPGWSTAANTPFRLHKSWVHEGGVSSPLIARWPAGIRDGGGLRHTPSHFIDILPTLLELAGVDPDACGHGPAAPPLPGRSLVPAFAHDTHIPHPYLFFHHNRNRALRVGDSKLVAKGADGPWELYDLSCDRAETQDLAAAHPERVAELAARWQELEDEFRTQAGPAPD
jgi:arylsulfatase